MSYREGNSAELQYDIHTKAFNISEALAKKIDEKFVSSIDNFDPGGPPARIIDAGSVMFCCTGNNCIVKTLIVRHPVREIGKLSGTCLQLIEDLQSGPLDEAKYLSLFE